VTVDNLGNAGNAEDAARTTPLSVVSALHTYDQIGCYADAAPYCKDHCPAPGQEYDGAACYHADHALITPSTETDVPEHCSTCNALLDTRLTSDGIAYVLDAIEDADGAPDLYPDHHHRIVRAWAANWRDVLNIG